MIDRAQLLTFRQAVQSQLETLLPCTVTIDGTEYDAAGGTIDYSGQTNSRGGQIIDTIIRFRILKETLSNVAPEPDAILTYSGKDYRITSVVDGTTDPAYVLTCEQIVEE